MALRIVYEGDEAAAKSHLPVAQNLLHKVREFVAASGAGVYSSRLTIDERSYAYAIKAGDLEALHIYVQPLTPAPPPMEEATELPDFLSGVIRGGWMRTETRPPLPGGTADRKVKILETFRPNNATAKRLKKGTNFDDSARLAVAPEGDMFSGISSNITPPADRKATQYVSIRPSNYTGRMQRLVQVCLGFGRLPPSRVHSSSPKRRATVIAEGLQLIYDYRFYRTHGLAVGKDKTLWLIEVCGHTGVMAMPLPLVPDPQRLLAGAPEDIAAAVKEFGGLPSGDGFPTGPRLQKMIASGDVLQLLTPDDLKEFYDHQPYYSACGWAFNPDGSEAHNTCWDYTADDMKHGYHYSIKLTIGALTEDRKPDEPIAKVEAKLLKISEGKLYYPVDPPINGDYPLGVPQPPFKIFEPSLDVMIDFKFAPRVIAGENERVYRAPLVCDTAVLVYFSDEGQLKQVKYYYDHQTKNTNTIVTDKTYAQHPETSWTSVETIGILRVAPMFYSSDVDDRREVVQQRITKAGTGALVGYGQGTVDSAGTTDIHGGLTGWTQEPLGQVYTQGDIAEMKILNPFREGWIKVEPGGAYVRHLVYELTTTERREIDPSIASGIAVPEGLRAGFVYVFYSKRSGYNFVETWTSISLRDHYAYHGAALQYAVNGPIEVIVWRSLGFIPYKNMPFDQSISFLDVKDVVDTGEWASPGQPVEYIERPYRGSERRETFTPAVASFTSTLYTDHEPGGIQLQSITNYDAAMAEWKTWYTPVLELFGSPKVRMGVYYSSGLGERQMVYDTKLLGKTEDRKYYGNLVSDQSGTPLVKFNFIGVP